MFVLGWICHRRRKGTREFWTVGNWAKVKYRKQCEIKQNLGARRGEVDPGSPGKVTVSRLPRAGKEELQVDGAREASVAALAAVQGGHKGTVNRGIKM